LSRSPLDTPAALRSHSDECGSGSGKPTSSVPRACTGVPDVTWLALTMPDQSMPFSSSTAPSEWRTSV
jgi:hypothetical protein